MFVCLCLQAAADVNLACEQVKQNNWEEGNFINYKKMSENLQIVRSRLKRPLTYSEKILYSHLDDPEGQDIERGTSYLKLRPDVRITSLFLHICTNSPLARCLPGRNCSGIYLYVI